MLEKVLGYLLVITGVATIVFSALNVYQVFTKKIKPIQLFNFSGVTIDTGQLLGNKMPEGFTPSKTELIRPDLINETSNIAAHVFLMGFLVNIGYRIASLGMMLVRPIVVKLRTKEVVEDKTPEKITK